MKFLRWLKTLLKGTKINYKGVEVTLNEKNRIGNTKPGETKFDRIPHKPGD